MNAPAPQQTAVVIDDDAHVRGLLVTILSAAGFQTIAVDNGSDGVDAVIAHRPDITTLDVNMPGIDGFETARRIREHSDTHIMLITALSDEADAVLGFSVGADDVVVKPFRPRELRARVLAAQRRRQSAGGAVQRGVGDAPNAAAPASAPGMHGPGPHNPGTHGPGPHNPGAHNPGPYTPGTAGNAPGAAGNATGTAHPTGTAGNATGTAHAAGTADNPTGTAHPTESGMPPATDHTTPPTSPNPAVRGIGWNGLHLVRATHSTTVDGAAVALTRTEFDLLATILEAAPEVRSKADLVRSLHDEPGDVTWVSDSDERSIETHITNLRRKLGDSASAPRFIETVRGVGYRAAAPAER
ncbi:response regulator [Microbacterium sp. MC2]